MAVGWTHEPGEGNDDVAIFVELMDDMPAFRRLLDAGPHVHGSAVLRFGGFYRYAKILEAIAAGIGSGEIRVPK